MIVSMELNLHEHESGELTAEPRQVSSINFTIHIGAWPHEVTIFFRSMQSLLKFTNDLRDKAMDLALRQCRPDVTVDEADLVPSV